MNQALEAVLRNPHKEDVLWGGVQFSLEEERPIIHVLNPEGSVSHTFGEPRICAYFRPFFL